MTEPIDNQARYHSIRLNSKKGNRMLYGLALTFPLWGLTLPSLVLSSSYDASDVAYSAQASDLILHEFVHSVEYPLIAISLICAYFTIKLYFKRVKLSTRPSLSRQGKLNSNLTALKLVKEKGLDCLEFKLASETKTVTHLAPVANINAQDAALLLNIIGDTVDPIADKDVLKLLRKQKLKVYERDSQDSLAIDYASHMSMRRLTAVILENERYFWLTWLILCGLAAILTFVTLTGCIPHWLATHFMGAPRTTPPSQMENDVLRGLATILAVPAGFVSMLIVAACAPPTLAMAAVSNTQMGQMFLLCTALSSSMFLVTYLARPNRLLLDDKGIRSVLHLGSSNFTFGSIDWRNLASINLVKPGKQTDPSRWLLNFVPVNGPTFDFSLGGLMDAGSKLAVLSAIQKWAPHVFRDAEVEEALRSGSTQSYTELWLQSLATPPKREKLTPLLDGQSLKDGKYLIHKQYGAGGQGLTYLASDLDMAEEKAEEASLIIKESMLPLYVDEAARKKAVERFEREALLLSTLSSEHIAELKDYFIEDHRSYLVLSRIAGMDLKQFVETDGPMSPEKILALAEQMCGILAYLHGLSPPVVHRDFTPDNLILSSTGLLKLIDFEVAHEMKSRSTATVVGKHAYIPPEQLRGKPEAASDLYAMGATLYFLATGSDPEPLERSALPLSAKSSEDGKRLSDLISDLTALEADKRLSLQEVRARLAESSANESPDGGSKQAGNTHIIKTGKSRKEVREAIVES